MIEPRRGVRVQEPDPLFDRIVTILEEARGNVVRAVNTGMVTAYWLIGREIVEALQGGEERAEYGKQVVENLSARLPERYGRGFSGLSLQRFRKFYLIYRERLIIPSPPGTEFEGNEIPSPSGTETALSEKLHLTGGESASVEKQHPAGVKSCSEEGILSPTGRELVATGIGHPAGTESAPGFSPLLSWSHYRALMRVEDAAARAFYEREAAECGWSKAQLERQIQSSYYQRILANRGEVGFGSTERERLPGVPISAGEVLKSPYVLEFLGLPDAPELHECVFEQARSHACAGAPRRGGRTRRPPCVPSSRLKSERIGVHGHAQGHCRIVESSRIAF